MSSQTIPVLDLHNFHAGGDRRQQFVTALGDSLQAIGFFAVVNHGVDRDLIHSAYQVATDFFDLPTAQKCAYEIPGLHGQRGYTSFGREHAKDHPVPDLKEFWHLGREGGIAYPANLTVAEVPEFHPTLAQLYTQLEGCATELLRATALALGEPEPLLAEMMRAGDTILRVIHYPPVPPDAPPASLRAAPHEDINLITLLCEATDDGLELRQRDGSWLPIRAVPGQIIMDSGDMLQHLTNGLFPSTTHRVVNPQGDRDRRFAMPFFVHPRREVDLSPLPSAIARTGGVPRYAPITAGDYLQQRLREIGLAG